MGRIAVVVAAVVAILALPQVAFGAPSLIAHSCGTNCGSLGAHNGRGTLNVNGNGVEWGSISSGTVKVQDKSHNGHRDWALTGCDKQFKDPSDETITVCTANNTIKFNVGTVWWLSLNGTGVSASVVASGSFYIKGSSGSYTLNGGKTRAWPSGGTFLKL
jgi:hypothetical protein